MIARKIIYKGQFNEEMAHLVFSIVRKNEITGEVKWNQPQEIVLTLEGDPSQIKLIQHQIERRVKVAAQNKTIETIPYQNFHTVTFLK